MTPIIALALLIGAVAAYRKVVRPSYHVPATVPDPDPSTGWALGARIGVVILLLAAVPSVAARMGDARISFGLTAIAAVLVLGAMPAWPGALSWILATKPMAAFRWMRLASMDPERRVAAVLAASLALARMDRDGSTWVPVPR